jgi:hypothetical protein
MSASSAQRRGNIANTAMGSAGTTAGVVTGIFAAAGAANAVPVAGQVAAAALALAGILTKVFVGRKQAREQRRKEAETRRVESNRQDVSPQPTQSLNVQGGVQAQQSIQQTAPVQEPFTPTLQYNDGGQQPTIQQPQRLFDRGVR